MLGMDMMMRSALNLLVTRLPDILAQLPPELVQDIGQLAQTGVGLQQQLNRIEAKQDVLEGKVDELRVLLRALVDQLTPRSNGHHVIRPAEHGDGEPPAEPGGLPASPFP